MHLNTKAEVHSECDHIAAVILARKVSHKHCVWHKQCLPDSALELGLEIPVHLKPAPK